MNIIKLTLIYFALRLTVVANESWDIPSNELLEEYLMKNRFTKIKKPGDCQVFLQMKDMLDAPSTNSDSVKFAKIVDGFYKEKKIKEPFWRPSLCYGHFYISPKFEYALDYDHKRNHCSMISILKTDSENFRSCRERVVKCMDNYGNMNFKKEYTKENVERYRKCEEDAGCDKIDRTQREQIDMKYCNYIFPYETK